MMALSRVVQMSVWQSLRQPPPRPRAFAVRNVAIAEEMRAACISLARAERLLEAPSPPALQLPPRPALRVVPPPPEPEPQVDSDWDPEPPEVALVALVDVEEEHDRREDDEEVSRLERDNAMVMQEINGCKTLLLEVIRRAAYDWVLYRGHKRLAYRILAEQAYAWLFTERPGTKDWNIRERDGKFITSLEAICEALDLDPDNVRRHVKVLTPKHVTSVGRPAEYRRRDVFSSSQGEDDSYAVPSGLVVDSNPSDDDVIY